MDGLLYYTGRLKGSLIAGLRGVHCIVNTGDGKGWVFGRVTGAGGVEKVKYCVIEGL